MHLVEITWTNVVPHFRSSFVRLKSIYLSIDLSCTVYMYNLYLNQHYVLFIVDGSLFSFFYLISCIINNWTCYLLNYCSIYFLFKWFFFGWIQMPLCFTLVNKNKTGMKIWTFWEVWKKILLTLVFQAVLVHYVLHRLGSSQLPLLSEGVVLPPLFPDGTKRTAKCRAVVYPLPAA